YEFTVVNRAGSYWFHPHPHGRTGKQVYFGLAGMFLVSDDEEATLNVPRGAYDIPLIVQDRIFDHENQLVYLSGSTLGGPTEQVANRGMMGRGMGQMMAGMMGMFGDRILVNGQTDTNLSFEPHPYRLRLLNACNSRIIKLAWNDGSPLTVIGTDGGLLGKPLQRPYLMLAPAERADLWVDFSRWPTGTELALQSLAFESGMSMTGMMGGASLPDGAPFPVLKARIVQSTTAPAIQPPQLIALPPVEPALAVNANSPKVFNLTMGMMKWGINGNSFEMQGVTALETVRLGTHEIWEFRNDARSGMMMTMAHSMHVHGLQFRVLGRSVDDRYAAAYATVKAGFLDEGWKDTVLVMPGERVQILLRFADYPGLFLYHCHMLEHEDSGLMRNYLVKS
ncbi:MAG: multicopper oxidase domain-containing protein, partial [Herbaspirillum sp.]